MILGVLLSQELISRHAARFVHFDMGMYGGDTKNLGNLNESCAYSSGRLILRHVNRKTDSTHFCWT